MTTDGSRLVYPEIGADGYPTLDRAKGTVRFWFRPDWTVSQMPAIARLVSVGASSTLKDNWWTLEITAVGQPATSATINFKTQVGGNEVVYFSATLPTSSTLSLNWAGAKWHQIALTYEPTNIVLYVDKAVTAQATTTTAAPFVLAPTSDKRILERLSFGG